MTSTTPPVDSAIALILAACGLIYCYFAISLQWLFSGLPLLFGLILTWTFDSTYLSESPRLLLSLFVGINLLYVISSTSYVLYPPFSISCWLISLSIATWRSPALRSKFQPIVDQYRRSSRKLEQKVAAYKWPVLDFDGKGMLSIGTSSIDIRSLSFKIGNVDLTFEVDDQTKILAKLDMVSIRLGRDIRIGELYCNIKGDGPPANELKSFGSMISREPSSLSLYPKRTSEDESRNSAAPSPPQGTMKRLPPLSPAGITVASSTSTTPSKAVPPPPLPPRLPLRNVSNNSISSLDSRPQTGDEEIEQEHIRLAMQASLADADLSSSQQDNVFGPNSSNMRGSSETIRSSLGDGDDGSLFFPENDEIDGAFMHAALDEGAISHRTEIANPHGSDSDLKAAMAASLEDQIPTTNSAIHQIKLSVILSRIPWWLKINLGPLVTRIILSVLAWLHPLSIASIAATSTGKRLTNLMEMNGLKKAHPNQEIFRLIRKLFLWLEAGDISLTMRSISVQPHIPMAADNDISVVVKASQPTAYRNTSGTEEVLAKIDGLKGSFKIPTFLLPNHESYIPKSPRSTIPGSILLSLPGVFNRELLTIGAAFVKAVTMMDLRHTAQNRPPTTMPLTSHGGKFSFKTFGLAVKQAAGDLAKEKGVQWGVRDAELAKWTAKFARLMGVVKVDVGGAFDIPVDLMKLRRKASIRELKRQSTQSV